MASCRDSSETSWTPWSENLDAKGDTARPRSKLWKQKGPVSEEHSGSLGFSAFSFATGLVCRLCRSRRACETILDAGNRTTSTLDRLIACRAPLSPEGGCSRAITPYLSFGECKPGTKYSVPRARGSR